MIRPDFLKKGDTIAIVAPGRKINNTDLAASVKIFESWGLNVLVGKNIFNKSHSYLSAVDPERLSDVQDALENITVKAIVCARGGYGSTRIIDQVNFDSLRKNPKWIVGFSDITVFHLKLNVLGFESMHSTMPILFSKSESINSIESLRKVLFGSDEILSGPYKDINKLGVAQGEVIGGNLSLFNDALATSSDPVTKGKILLLEEVGEYLYKIDRMINQLKRANKLRHIAGLVIGHFTDVLDTEVTFGETFEEIISGVIKEYDFPVAFGFPFGHDEPNLAWRSGGEAILNVTKDQSTLTFQR